jgi:hypothetical protein
MIQTFKSVLFLSLIILELYVSKSSICSVDTPSGNRTHDLPIQWHRASQGQGCQMASFRTKNPNLGKFWRFLQWKMLVYLMAIWSIFRPFGIVYGHLVYFPRFGYILPVLVCCDKKNLATPVRACLKHIMLRRRGPSSSGPVLSLAVLQYISLKWFYVSSRERLLLCGHDLSTSREVRVTR